MQSAGGGGGGGGGGTPTISLTTTSISRSSEGTGATALYGVDADGTVIENTVDQTSTMFFENWISDAAAAGNYDVMATLASGTTPTGTLGSWLALSADHSWSISVSPPGFTGGAHVSCVLTVKIRERASGTVKATATITMTATATTA